MKVSVSHWGIHDIPTKDEISLPRIPSLDMMTKFCDTITVKGDAKNRYSMSDDFIAAYKAMCDVYEDCQPVRL